MAIAVSGLRVELREVVLRDKPAEMLEVSPKGTVPVLVLSDGNVLEESLDIMRWALGQSDPEEWLGHINGELIAANDGPFKRALDRYKYPYRYDLSDGLASRDEGLKHLVDFNATLGTARFLAGERCGFTDVALFPFVRQFAATYQAWFDSLALPALQKWLLSLTGSALFAEIMVKYPQWNAGDELSLFP